MIDTLTGWQMVVLILGVLFTFCFVTFGWVVLAAWAAAFSDKWSRKKR